MVLLHQIVVRFGVIGMQWDAIHWTHLPTLGRIKVTYAFRALIGINLVDLNSHKDCIIRALGLTDIAIDALVRNQ